MVKITEDRIFNDFKILEQKLGKVNDLVEFLKNYEPQKFGIYCSQTTENEEFIDRVLKLMKIKLKLKKK